jgi:lysine 2,3-aminomutase
MYCRFCTRKRFAGKGAGPISKAELTAITGYLHQHPEIVDVIISGGDPLMLPLPQLRTILTEVRAVPSVQIIRIGTRIPAVWPQRITPDLLSLLHEFRHNLYLNVHFEHPRELTPEAKQVLSQLADLGIPLGNQAVLLKGINDKPEVMSELLRGLIRERVKPYYLFQCDLTEGVEHLRAPTHAGLGIMKSLRGRVSGLAIPTYVIDAPEGGGKTPFLPKMWSSVTPEGTRFTSSLGHSCYYPNPE